MDELKEAILKLDFHETKYMLNYIKETNEFKYEIIIEEGTMKIYIERKDVNYRIMMMELIQRLLGYNMDLDYILNNMIKHMEEKLNEI